MITLKKKGYTDRQIADKLDINQRVINKTYKRVVDRSLKLQVPLNNPRCYEYKITPHAKLVTQKKAERIVKKIISTTENRRKSAVQHIKEMNLKDLKYDRYGVQQPMSESCFKQLMYDAEYGHDVADWKTDLNDEHKRKRLNFALKYKDFDWKRRCVSSDEAKIKEKEHYNKKVWRAPDKKLSVNVINKKKQSHSKAMNQISERIGYNYKSKLVFLWEETAEEKRLAAAELNEKNEDRLRWNALMFAVNQAAKKQQKKTADRKKPNKKPRYDVFKKNELLTREDRSNESVDWFIYFKRVLKAEAFSDLTKLLREERDPVMIEDEAGNHTANNEWWGICGLHKFLNWPAKSPDLNPVEKAWAWCRQYLRDRNTIFNNRQKAIRGWKAVWRALPQETINDWIKKMPNVLQKIIDHEGDNDFQS